MIVTLDSKRRLTVPASLAPASPGEYFDARFDVEEDAIVFRRHQREVIFNVIDIGVANGLASNGKSYFGGRSFRGFSVEPLSFLESSSGHLADRAVRFFAASAKLT